MRILLVDDENLSRESMAKFLVHQLHHEVTQCKDGAEALEAFKVEPFPIILTDICMPDMSGIELLRRIKQLPEGGCTQIALFTGFANVDSAISALREGADDYIRKPIKAKELAKTIEKFVQNLKLMEANEADDQSQQKKLAGLTIENRDDQGMFQGSYLDIPGLDRIGVFSEKMRSIISMAAKFNDDRLVPVLIEGETGTGKEIIAKFIHYGYNADKRPFVSINCSAISPSLFESELFGYDEGAFTGAKKSGLSGKLELAQAGTLFLDELSDMPLELQPKILRALQEREIYRVGGQKKVSLDVRFIAATNQSVERLVQEGRFRKDLYYRLNMGRIQLPALRNNKESIIPLAQMFLVKYAKEKNRRFRFIHKDAIEILENYSWPGNIRELENIIDRIMLLYDEIEIRPEHIGFLNTGEDNLLDYQCKVLQAGSFILPEDSLDLKNMEAEIVRRALIKCNGNKSKTARYLGLTRGELRSRLYKAL